MRKIDILIPQYKETEEVIKPLLDSISVQQNIDLKNDVGVIIVNDGTDIKLSESFLNSYPFVVEYYNEEHKGVSATRNVCLDKSKAEYVMFCDADDMFCDVCGLFVVFNEMGIKGGFDGLVSVFREESKIPNTNQHTYINRGVMNQDGVDCTFVHGKIYNRQFLINNNIRWNDKLTIHEDSYFNCLCQKLGKEIRYCPIPFYLWKWRDDSVCRHDPRYLNRTYNNMLDSNTELVNQFINRHMQKEAEFYATSMIFDAYYSLNCDRWWDEEGQKFRDVTERRFKRYYEEFESLFNSIDTNVKSQIIMGIKNRFFQEGLFLEKITFEDWIKHIKSI